MSQAPSNLDFDSFEALSFDCYGTLIDWEAGILRALRPLLTAHGVPLSDRHILELYAALESEAEQGQYVRYRDVLGRVVSQLGDRLGFAPSAAEVASLAESLKEWEPFPDTVGALRALKQRYRLAIISNIDGDLFAGSAPRLGVAFDWVVTAEQAGAYKPSLSNFRVALDSIGIAPERLLHVAQSLYHDIAPAKALGLSTVWVNRRRNREGFGATPLAEAHPDLEVPDLKTLVSLMGPAPG